MASVNLSKQVGYHTDIRITADATAYWRLMQAALKRQRKAKADGDPDEAHRYSRDYYYWRSNLYTVLRIRRAILTDLRGRES